MATIIHYILPLWIYITTIYIYFHILHLPHLLPSTSLQKSLSLLYLLFLFNPIQNNTTHQTNTYLYIYNIYKYIYTYYYYSYSHTTTPPHTCHHNTYTYIYTHTIYTTITIFIYKLHILISIIILLERS